MNVIVLSTMYPNSVMYLSGVFVHEQVKALKRLQVNIKVIAPVPIVPFPLNKLSYKWKNYSNIPDKEIIDGIEVYHPRYIAIPGGILKGYWGFFLAKSSLKVINKFIETNQIDLIHAHGSLPDDHSAQIVSQKLNIPYVVTVHGSTIHSVIKKRYFYRSKQAILNANAVIGISNKVVRKIEETIGMSKNVFRVFNGYTLTDLKSKKNTEKLIILFGGNMVASKRCDFLLRAYSELFEEFKEIHLIVAGGGVLLNKMKRLASELYISDRVTFKGTVDHQTMLGSMAECDIFILPSIDEGFGIVYLEAMSFKKPVIGTEGEGICDIIEDGVNGLLVKPNNVDSIVEKLKLLIESSELRTELGIKGYDSIKKLTWEKNARETLNIYELISQKT